jgi:hypothetical protein
MIGGLFPRAAYSYYKFGSVTTFPGEFTELRIRFNLPKDLALFKPCFHIVPGKELPVILRDGNYNLVKTMRWKTRAIVVSGRKSSVLSRGVLSRPCTPRTTLAGSSR